MAALAIRNLIANESFKGSQDGGRTDFSENLRASLFNVQRPIELTAFSQIHLAGQCL
jgi:hypothetical protein